MTTTRSIHLGVLRLVAVLVGSIALPYLCATVLSAEHRSGALSITVNANRVAAITNHDLGASWLQQPVQLYSLGNAPDSVGGALHLQAVGDGRLRATLTITNRGDSPARVAPVFPQLQRIHPGGSTASLAYFYPRVGAAYGTAPIKLRRHYSGGFPHQFMVAHHPEAGALWIMTQDTQNLDKTYWLRKDDQLAMGVDWRARELAPSTSWTLPPVIIGIGRTDWREAFRDYRDWLLTAFPRQSPVNSGFNEAFNLRQKFLHTNLDDPGIFDPATKRYTLADRIAAETPFFGGIDFVHLFDWSQTPDQGRVGEYDPWHFLGKRDNFRIACQATSQPFGLYLEGYLIDKRSATAKAHGNDWMIHRSTGTPPTNFGSNYVYACPQIAAWRKHLVAAAKRAVADSGAAGIYVDQFGFANQYACYNPAHGHALPGSQITGEKALLSQLRRELLDPVAIYTEEAPNDATAHLLDGSFTYSVSQGRQPNGAPAINLMRFARPTFKSFQILRVDAPLGHDRDGIRQTFFNGDGFWLAGPAANERWFPTETATLIRKTHAILRRYREAFRGPDPEPLVPTLQPDLYANRFTGKSAVVWTLFNASDAPLAGDLLRVRHRPGASYYDAWNNLPLTPRIIGDTVVLTGRLPPRGTGCIVRKLPAAQ